VIIDKPEIIRTHLQLSQKLSAAPSEQQLKAFIDTRKACNRHYTTIQTNDSSEDDLCYVKVINFDTTIAHKMSGFFRQRLMNILTVANPKPRTFYLSCAEC